MPGSKKKRSTISWRRPSNRSSRLAGPFGPSKRYSFSTSILGIRRRSAASASRARVCSFSFTSSFSRAAFHSSGVTIGGICIGLVLLQVLVDDVEQPTPQGPLSIHPVGRLAEHIGLEREAMRPAHDLAPHNTRLLQDLQVLADRGLGYPEASGR